MIEVPRNDRIRTFIESDVWMHLAVGLVCCVPLCCGCARRDKEVGRDIAEHVAECKAIPRIQRLEVRFGMFLGFMAGSGLLGGLVGAIATRIAGG